MTSNVWNAWVDNRQPNTHCGACNNPTHKVDAGCWSDLFCTQCTDKVDKAYMNHVGHPKERFKERAQTYAEMLFEECNEPVVLLTLVLPEDYLWDYGEPDERDDESCMLNMVNPEWVKKVERAEFEPADSNPFNKFKFTKSTETYGVEPNVNYDDKDDVWNPVLRHWKLKSF